MYGTSDVMFFFSSRRRHTRSVSAFLLNRSSDLLIVQLHFSKLFLILKSGVNHTSRGSISTSTLPSIKLRRSEERFSRNAETDLVCRLLLEKKRPQPLRHRTNQYGHPARPRQALDLLSSAHARVRREHDARQGIPLQLRAHARHPDHDAPPAAPGAEPQQPDQPPAHAAGAGAPPVSPGAPSPLPPLAALSPTPGAGSSSLPSSVISFRKAMSLSAISAVMSAIRSTSSRSRSRMSCSVLCPARSRTSTSSTGRPFSSRSETLVAASSSVGGSGAKSGPSPPRSSHSRLEYRSIFQPVSSEASRTFCPLRPMASES